MDILSVCVLYVCVLSRVLCLLPVEVDAHAEALSPHDEGAGLRLEWGGVGPWCSDTPSGKQKNGCAISCLHRERREERSEEKVTGRGEQKERSRLE